MAALDPETGPARLSLLAKLHHKLMGRIARPDFQSWAARFPLTRRAARKDGERLFDLVSGFAYSQTLLAVVELELLEKLQARPQSIAALALASGLDQRRTEILCKAAAALGLIGRCHDGRYRIARLGAATLGVPGLRQMIRHHSVFYADLADPVALLKGKTDPQLARFWPYVRGAVDTPDAAIYSDLMAQSQGLVADETLRTVEFREITHLMDIGGGTGAFARAVRADHPHMRLSVMDLPPVVEAAGDRFASAGIEGVGGSFLDPLPKGADAISLIRVLYDHNDETIRQLLANVLDALPAGGRLIISEPMSGGDSPTRAGDVYFSLYTLAMTTGKARSADEIGNVLRQIGFEKVDYLKNPRSFITSCITARKPGGLPN